MSIDVLAIKNNLELYRPFSPKVSVFAKYVADEIIQDHAHLPIDDVRTYLEQKLETLRLGYTTNNKHWDIFFRHVEEKDFFKILKYCKNLADFVVKDSPPLDEPRSRVPELITFFDAIRSKPARIEGQPKYVANFPQIATDYVNGKVNLTPPVLEELELLAISPGRA